MEGEMSDGGLCGKGAPLNGCISKEISSYLDKKGAPLFQMGEVYLLTNWFWSIPT